MIARAWPTLLILAACTGMAFGARRAGACGGSGGRRRCDSGNGRCSRRSPSTARLVGGAPARGLVVGQREAGGLRPQPARARDRALCARRGGRHGADPPDGVRTAGPGGDAPFRRRAGARARAAPAPCGTVAASGRRHRLPCAGRRTARARRRLRRACLARTSRRPRGSPRRRLARRGEARWDRRSLRPPPPASRARGHDRARRRTPRGPRRDRARRGRRARAGAPGQLQGLRAVPPARRVGAERRVRGGSRAGARVVARDPPIRGAAGGARGDSRLRPRRRLAALRRPRGRRGRARVAGLAAVAAARPLALPRARRGRPARVDARVAARAGVPALVRRGGLDLPARASTRPHARGLPDPACARARARGLHGLRRGDCPDPVAPVRRGAALFAARQRARDRRDAAAPRPGAGGRARRARAARPQPSPWRG